MGSEILISFQKNRASEETVSEVIRLSVEVTPAHTITVSFIRIPLAEKHSIARGEKALGTDRLRELAQRPR